MIEHLAFLKILNSVRTAQRAKGIWLRQWELRKRFECWDAIAQFLSQEMSCELPEILKIKMLCAATAQKVKEDFDAGLNYTFWGDEIYPNQLKHLNDPPLVLSFEGNPAWLKQPCFSVVGSRDLHSFAESWMQKELRLFMKSEDISVVSGGARGADQAAHELACRQGRSTIVVLPSGLKRKYPSSLSEIAREVIASGGCFLSEYDSEFEIRKHLFQHRNRLIAAMNQALLIVEAKAKSGSLMTGHLALEIGRPVWVVPGHPQMPSYSGSLELLQQGAQLIRNFEDMKLFWDCELHSFPHNIES